MTTREVEQWWLPLIRRVVRGAWPSDAELARAIRSVGIPRAMWKYVAARLGGTLKRPAHRTASPAEERLRPALWLAIDVRMREAEYVVIGHTRREARGLALKSIAAGWRPSGRKAKPIKAATLEDRIADMRKVAALASLEPSLADAIALIRAERASDPDVRVYHAERAKRIRTKRGR
jgi:hypothetical protein